MNKSYHLLLFHLISQNMLLKLVKTYFAIENYSSK